MPRITAKFCFEIPFNIRMLGENVCKPVTLHLGEDQVIVYPPARQNKQNGAPCWDSDPEHSVGSVNNIPLWLADMVLIDVKREIKSNTITQEDADNFLSTASELLVRLLQTCRWRTSQTWITVFNLPRSYTVRYYDEAGNRIRGEIADIAGAIKIIIVGDLPYLDNSIWDTICRDLVSEATPELWEELLLDAEDALPRYPRRAVIDAGAACEVFIESFCRKLASACGADKEVYQELTPRFRTFPEYFHIVLRYLIKHSLKDEHPESYNEIEHLYKTVNSVRHEGRCEYKDERGRAVDVGSREAGNMVTAARSAIEWANSLQNES